MNWHFQVLRIHFLHLRSVSTLHLRKAQECFYMPCTVIHHYILHLKLCSNNCFSMKLYYFSLVMKAVRAETLKQLVGFVWWRETQVLEGHIGPNPCDENLNCKKVCVTRMVSAVVQRTLCQPGIEHFPAGRDHPMLCSDADTFLPSLDTSASMQSLEGRGLLKTCNRYHR